MKKIGLLFVMVISFIFTVSCVSKEVPITETYYETEYKTESYTEIVKEGEDELKPEIHWDCELMQILEQHPELCDGSETFQGVWYLGYKLPKHSSSKVIIQTWDNSSRNRMVSANNVTTAGYTIKPPICKSLYTTYISPGTQGYKEWRSPNVFPYEERAFNEWLGQFNTKIPDSELGSQFSCTCPTIRGCVDDKKLEYQFDTTGVNSLEIIIAGKEFSIDYFGNISFPETIGIAGPIKSIKLYWSDEVTKQRQVPYQVEKQRTVMQTKQVPFWEAIFSK
jgi:hypothetical protein